MQSQSSRQIPIINIHIFLPSPPFKCPTKLQMVKFRVQPVLVPMQIVHESEATVETLSHHINGKPERIGRVELMSEKGRHAQYD
jgi:hypothetical protein